MTNLPGVPDPAPATLKQAFDLSGRVAVITGGAGLLGVKHAEAVIELGGIPVLVDIAADAAKLRAKQLIEKNGGKALGLGCDITNEDALVHLHKYLRHEFGRVDILINNAANNPKVEDGLTMQRFSRLETFPLSAWQEDLAVGLTGAFLCSRVFGTGMAASGKGVILNIASELGLIAPDQSLYRIEDGRAETEQPVKPVTYSVVKAGLIGLTRYLATYWPDRVRVNALAPGGVYADQPPAFLTRYAQVVPMARMAHRDELKGAVAYLISDASSFVTGTTLVVDGGHTAW